MAKRFCLEECPERLRSCSQKTFPHSRNNFISLRHLNSLREQLLPPILEVRKLALMAAQCLGSILVLVHNLGKWVPVDDHEVLHQRILVAALVVDALCTTVSCVTA